MPLNGPYVVWKAKPVEWDTSEARGGTAGVPMASSASLMTMARLENLNGLRHYRRPPSLDFLHDGFLDISAGTIRDTNVPGPNNDITDDLDAFFNADSADFKRSTLFIWGEYYANSGGGVHQVHMNQGNYSWNPDWYHENGRGQDGGIVLRSPDGKWKYFLSPLPGRLVSGQSSGVQIHSALVNPHGPDNTLGQNDRVRLINRANDPASLVGWTIQNQDGKLKHLPDVLLPGNGAMRDIDVGPESYLPNNRDGEIVLKDAGGAEVHRVSYQANAPPGRWISFLTRPVL
ncbi:hypothetical protein FSOLCH5_015169 [Fusarium solani]